MNKLYRRILFKYAQAVSNWEIFREEANKIINEKRIAAYDLYHYVKQKESSSPINVKDLLNFYNEINGFDDNASEINFSQVKNQIELAFKELMRFINAKTEINDTLRFCREYGFLIYELILRCRDEIILSKTDSISLFQEKFLNKYSYIKGLKTVITVINNLENPTVSEFKILIGKIFKICNINTNDTIEVTINDFSYEFVFLLGEIIDNLSFEFPIHENFGKGLDNGLIKQIRSKNSDIRHTSFMRRLDDFIDYNDLAIIRINEAKDNYSILRKITSALSDFDKLDRETMEFVLSKLNDVINPSKLEAEKKVDEELKVITSYTENACENFKIDPAYIENKFPNVYQLIYAGRGK